MRRYLPIIIVIVAIVAGAYIGYRKGVRKTALRGSALVASFLDVDFGNAIVVETPEKQFVVIDPGPKKTSAPLINYLKDIGAQSLTVIITNASDDHIGALDSLIESFPIKRILHGETDIDLSQAIANAATAEVSDLILSAGDVIHISPSVKLEVLSPPKGLLKDIKQTSENSSLVIRLLFGKTSLLLTSHAMVDAEGYLIRSVDNLRSNVLVVGRHGRRGSTSLELLSVVKPECCIVMSGAGSDKPSKTILDRISTKNTGAEVYRTDKDGLVDVISNGRSITVARGFDDDESVEHPKTQGFIDRPPNKRGQIDFDSPHWAY